MDYLKSWFLIDLIATFPWWILNEGDIDPNSQSAKTHEKLLRIFRLNKITKLMRMFKLFKLFRIFKYMARKTNSNFKIMYKKAPSIMKKWARTSGVVTTDAAEKEVDAASSIATGMPLLHGAARCLAQ